MVRSISQIASTASAQGFACLLAAGFLAAAAPASAQPVIGGAAVVKNNVQSRKDNTRNFFRVVTGTRVHRDDHVRTRTDSMTKIVFLDTTNMSVGPDSEVKLDKFVYNGDGTAKTVAIEATRGAFRFFSGNSPSKAYQVTTPQAVIGVRGTTYDVRVTNGITLVVLQEGEVNVCVRNTARCRVLNQPGQSVSVNDTDISDVLQPANKPWDFASVCANGAGELCNKTTRFALAPPPPPPPPAARPPAPRSPAVAPPAAPSRARPVRRVERPHAQPSRVSRIRPRRPVRQYDPPPRRIVSRPTYQDVPAYDPPPGRIIRDSWRPRCYPGSRHPRCRIVRPGPAPCYRSRGCGVRPPPVVKPNPCRYSRSGCGVRPPKHGRPGWRPRPGRDHGYGRPGYRPRMGQPGGRFGRPGGYRPRNEGRSGFGGRGGDRGYGMRSGGRGSGMSFGGRGGRSGGRSFR